MLAHELIALLERQRSAEQMLNILGPHARQTVEEFERFNTQKAQLIDKLRSVDETR